MGAPAQSLRAAPRLPRGVLACLLALAVAFTAGCSERATLRIHLPGNVQGADFERMAAILREQEGIELELHRAAAGSDVEPLQLLAAGSIDLAVTENSAGYTPGVNTVLPLYRGVLHILYRRDLALESVIEILDRDSVFIAGGSPVARDFLDFQARRFGRAPAELKIVGKFEPGVTEVLIVFSPLLPAAVTDELDGYALLGFDEAERLGKGSRVESIPYLFPQVRPFLIPAGTYPRLGNDAPVVTVAVDMLLVTRSDVARATIYRLAEGLMRQRTALSEQWPELFHSLTDQFDPLTLKFPLHPGAADFVNRNAPSFLERYAEVINLLSYLAVALATGVLGLMKWGQRRRKERIDRFYVQLLEIRAALRGPDADRALLGARLDALEAEAFELLVREKLAADESFRIFLSLLAQARSALEP